MARYEDDKTMMKLIYKNTDLYGYNTEHMTEQEIKDQEVSIEVVIPEDSELDTVLELVKGFLITARPWSAERINEHIIVDLDSYYDKVRKEIKEYMDEEEEEFGCDYTPSYSDSIDDMCFSKIIYDKPQKRYHIPFPFSCLDVTIFTKKDRSVTKLEEGLDYVIDKDTSELSLKEELSDGDLITIVRDDQSVVQRI